MHEWAVWIQRHFIVIELITCAFALAALTYGGIQYYSLAHEYEIVKHELASTTATYKKVTADLREKFAAVSNYNASLSNTLSAEQNKNEQFQAQINGVKGAVATLTKLSETDKELLQKYSKIYFLNENYIPSNVSVINVKYNSNRDTVLEFHSKALPFLTRMLDDANSSALGVKVVSAYRSFGTQANLKADYKVSYGSGANKFSADQGYSEHQLATALDLAPADGSHTLVTSFASTTAFRWLDNNAHKYGFILSYPKSNSYYMYEPWHWRFVGVALATRLHDEKKNFYDLDQRTIDSYLALIFD
jgi:LAS superfamily LD-carboxypeptidase LdcB